MPLFYQSGEEIMKDDNVFLHSDAGQIEFIADPVVSDPDTRWYVEEFGGGVMIMTPSMGRVFSSDTKGDDDLEFVSRAE